MNYQEMEICDYDSIIKLWEEVEGVKLRDADSRDGISKYLIRNPALSFIALNEDEIIGTIMAGHDGKRGYIQHLAVSSNYRKKGVATKLCDLCIKALKKEGIVKSHIFILKNNEIASTYWKNQGWEKRNDIEVYSFINSYEKNS